VIAITVVEQIVAMDLEGIVCKRKDSPYKVTEKPSRHWIKALIFERPPMPHFAADCDDLRRTVELLA